MLDVVLIHLHDRPTRSGFTPDLLVRIASNLPNILGALAAQPLLRRLLRFPLDPSLVLLLLSHTLHGQAVLEVVQLALTVLHASVPVDRFELWAERKTLRPLVKHVGARRHLRDGC